MKLVSVPPRRHLRPLRLAYAHQGRAVSDPREPDVVRGDPKPRVAKRPLALLDRFPPFFERREVPALARAAHDPQSSLRGVERQATADRKVLDRLVGSEAGVTEDAGGVQLRP